MANQNLSLESTAFLDLRNDFRITLESLVQEMLNKDVSCASVAIKIDVSIDKAVQNDSDIKEYYAERDVYIPRFKHKITAQMQLKSERQGMAGGDYELIQSHDGRWVLHPVSEQLSIVDDMGYEDPSEE